MVPRPPGRLVPACVAALALGACARGDVSGVARPPEYAPKAQAKCGVVKSQAEPLVVEWPAPTRQKLEALVLAGAVAVRYVGCEMEVLAGCHVPGAYQYTGTTLTSDHVGISDADQLYASLPVGAAGLEARLEKGGTLDVSMTLIGRWQLDGASLAQRDLSGDCARATHVVTALTVGAFEFYATAMAHASAGAGLAGLGAG